MTSLRNRARDAMRQLLHAVGYDVIRTPGGYPRDLAPDRAFIDICERCRPYTMTSTESMFALYSAVRYVVANRIPGDFVECGVWRGGSMMLCALTLQACDETNRTIHLFDTFSGMVEPTEHDVNPEGIAAHRQWQRGRRENHNAWAYAPLDEVQRNLASTGYPVDRFRFVRGRVEDTVPRDAPPSIALLRLDTDWYESTSHELNHLYPRLTPRGVTIVDDYGSWRGSRMATDEFLAAQNHALLLTRVDAGGRLFMKP